MPGFTRRKALELLLGSIGAAFTPPLLEACAPVAVQQPTSNPEELSRYLSGAVLREREADLYTAVAEDMGELDAFITAAFLTNYLDPLNTPFTGNAVTFENPSTYNGHVFTGETSWRDENNASYSNYGSLAFTISEDSLERIIYRDGDLGFQSEVSPDGTSSLSIYLPGLKGKVVELGLGYNENSCYSYSSRSGFNADDDCNLLQIESQTNGTIVVNFPSSLVFPEHVAEAFRGYFGRLSTFTAIHNLAKERFGINSYLQDHRSEIDTLFNELREESRQRQEQESVQRSREQAVSSLLEQFQEEMGTVGSYNALLNRPDFEPFFSQYPNLVRFTNVFTRQQDPEGINHALGRITEIVAALPQDYQNLLPQLTLHLAYSTTDLEVTCDWELAGACYENSTVRFYSTESGTFIHELAHAKVGTLSQRQQRRLAAIIEPIVSLSEMQANVIRSNDQRHLVTNWVNSLDPTIPNLDPATPNYVCTTSYCASNTSEFLAEYVSDIFFHNGAGIRSIVDHGNNDYRRMIVTAIDALVEYGLLGENGTNVANTLYTNAGLTPESLTELR